MGGPAIELIAPAEGSIAAAEPEFRWSGELGEDELFVLYLTDETGDGLDVQPEPLKESSWRPPAELVAGWPERVRFRVAVKDVFDEVTRHSAWRTVRIER
jgi:hypothetical protein